MTLALKAKTVADPEVQMNFDQISQEWMVCPSYTTTSLPTASSVPAGSIVFVSNAPAGSQFQGSTGSAWVSLG